MRALYGPREGLATLGAALRIEPDTRWECIWDPGFQAITKALCLEAPETVGGVVVVTSTHRPAKPGHRFSWHWRFGTLDWRTGIYRDSNGELALHRDWRGAIVARDAMTAFTIAERWRDRVATRLGSDFDVQFGDENHIDHGHAEHDGSKAARVYDGR